MPICAPVAALKATMISFLSVTPLFNVKGLITMLWWCPD